MKVTSHLLGLTLSLVLVADFTLTSAKKQDKPKKTAEVKSSSSKSKSSPKKGRGIEMPAIAAPKTFPEVLAAASDTSLNGRKVNDLPIAKSDFCKFGKPIAGKCRCSGGERMPICGSDLENYENVCEFNCALKCNPRLDRYDGECPKTGGLPKKPRLNFTKKEKKLQEIDSSSHHDGDGPGGDPDDPEEDLATFNAPKVLPMNRGAQVGLAMDEYSSRKK